MLSPFCIHILLALLFYTSLFKDCRLAIKSFEKRYLYVCFARARWIPWISVLIGRQDCRWVLAASEIRRLKKRWSPAGFGCPSLKHFFKFFSLVLFLMHCVSDIHITGRLSPVSHDVAIDEPTWMGRNLPREIYWCFNYKAGKQTCQSTSCCCVLHLPDGWAAKTWRCIFSQLWQRQHKAVGWTLQCELRNFFFSIIRLL